MKAITYKYTYIVTFMLLLFVSNSKAQENSTTTIHVQTAGTLPSLIGESQKYKITNLTLTGQLNGTDIRFIREMAGRNYEGEATNGKLTVLDLSEANIVSGGGYYYYSPSAGNRYFYTYNNTIEDYMFHYCNLLSITIPNSVTNIGESAFNDCTGLTSITIPNSVTNIGSNAFSGCKRLTSVTIGNSVTSIGSEAFSRCTGLTSITIPNSVTNIGSSAFSRCTGLTELTYNAKKCSMSSDWLSSYNIKKVTIGDEVEIIPERAFYECSGLSSIIIPNSVTYIGDYAFFRCTGLTSVTIGNSVTSIGESAFSGCKSLTSINLSSI